MKTLVVLLLLLPALAFGQGYFDGYTEGYGAAQSPEVITTIYSGRLTYPNAYADTTGVDVINMADDGSTIRYGYVDHADSLSVIADNNYIRSKGTYFERYDASPASQLAFVWLSLDGVIAGNKITSANFFLNVGSYTTQTIDSDSYFSVRVDTVSADYRCLDSVSQGTDPCRLDINWFDMDYTEAGTDSWDPPLNDRGKWFRFGPRSSSMLDVVAYNSSAGDSNVYDIIDGVQQIADRGQEYIDRGVLVVVSYVGNALRTGTFSAGNHATNVGDLGKGNPALSITTSSRRGIKAWGSGKAPVALMIDDLYPELPGYVDAIGEDGINFDMVAQGVGWDAQADSLYEAGSNRINFTAHTMNHPDLGDLSGDTLNYELAKETWIKSPDFTVMPDTSYMAMDFAWTGGSGTFQNMEALWKLPAYGYKSGRGTSLRLWHDEDVGSTTPLSLDAYTNIYTTNAVSLGGILKTGGSPETDPDVIKLRLLGFVDMVYTDYGRGALVTFGHNSALDGVTAENLDILAGIIDDAFFLERRSYGDLVNRVRSRGVMDIEDVALQTSALHGLSFADSVLHFNAYKSSAIQDSTATAEGVTVEALFDLMWVGPEGE